MLNCLMYKLSYYRSVSLSNWLWKILCFQLLGCLTPLHCFATGLWRQTVKLMTEWGGRRLGRNISNLRILKRSDYFLLVCSVHLGREDDIKWICWNFVWLCISYMMILKLNFGLCQDEIKYWTNHGICSKIISDMLPCVFQTNIFNVLLLQSFPFKILKSFIDSIYNKPKILLPFPVICQYFGWHLLD